MQVLLKLYLETLLMNIQTPSPEDNIAPSPNDVPNSSPDEGTKIPVDDAVTIKQIKYIVRTWRRMHILFNIGIALLGTSTIACSVFVSVYTGSSLPIGYIKTVAYLSTISLTLLTAFNFVGNTNNAIRAWKHVRVALMKYDCDIYDIDQLIEAYSQGEKMMGKIEFNYTVTQSSDSNEDERNLNRMKKEQRHKEKMARAHKRADDGISPS